VSSLLRPARTRSVAELPPTCAQASSQHTLTAAEESAPDAAVAPLMQYLAEHRVWSWAGMTPFKARRHTQHLVLPLTDPPLLRADVAHAPCCGAAVQPGGQAGDAMGHRHVGPRRQRCVHAATRCFAARIRAQQQRLFLFISRFLAAPGLFVDFAGAHMILEFELDGNVPFGAACWRAHSFRCTPLRAGFIRC
jgi:hypothetical protein